MQFLDELKTRLSEISALGGAAAVLDWDQQTYMPSGGGTARAAQMSALSKVIHEMSTNDETAHLLEAAEREASALDPDSDDAAFLRVVRRDFDKSVKLPTTLVAELSETTALAYEQWAQARADSDFSRFAPWLEKILDLTRQSAEHLGYAETRYDALLDQYEPGMTTAQARAMFEAIKPDSVALVKAIADKGPNAVDDSLLSRTYPEAVQERVGLDVVKSLGFDFSRGRSDRAVHPFCTSFTRGDVRITTRFDSHFLPMALYGSMHEAGHALYEQGSAERFAGNALEGGASLGVHESQSRLWENLVGRSRPFVRHVFPSLQTAFPDALGDVGDEAFYRAVNKVSPSLIRVEADEVTYNLHILLRFELENDLLDGRLSVKDAPAAWTAKMEQYLGLTPPDDASGILQDVHWSGGLIGYFPTYSVGNILSVQLYEKADADLNHELSAQIGRGEFGPLLDWLRENVHQWGRKYLPTELVQRVTGGPLDPAPYLKYLRVKFGEIYAL